MLSRNAKWDKVRSIGKTFRRYPRFLFVGATAYTIVVTGTIILTRYAHLWYLYAFMIAALVSWTFTFVANSRFTFRGHPGHRLAVRYAGHMTSYAMFSVASFAAVYVLTSLLGVIYPLSIAVVSATSSLYTYLFSKNVIFTYG